MPSPIRPDHSAPVSRPQERPAETLRGRPIIYTAFAVAFAMAGGSLLSTVSSTGFDGLLSTAGLTRATIAATQHEQAGTISTLDRSVIALATDLKAIKTKLDALAKIDPASLERLAKYDSELMALKTGLRTLTTDVEFIDQRMETIAKKTSPETDQRIAKLDASVTSLVRSIATVTTDVEHLGLRVDTIGKLDGEVASLKTSLSNTTTDIAYLDQRIETVAKTGPAPNDSRLVKIDSSVAALRLSIDAFAETRKAEIVAINKRLDKLESFINSDVTSSITPVVKPVATAAAPAQARKRPVRVNALAGWTVQEAREDRAVIAGRTGTFEVFPGTVVPGLGRIDAVRQHKGRWVVTTVRGQLAGPKTFQD